MSKNQQSLQRAVAVGQPDKQLLANEQGNTSVERSIPRVLATVPEACEALGLSRGSLYRLIHENKLSTVTVGRRRCIPVWALHAFADRQRNVEGS